MRVIARQNIWHNGAVLTAGGTYEVSPDDAAQFAKAGLADVPQAPETEKIKKNSPAENLPEKPAKAAPVKQTKAVRKAKK